MTPEDIPHDVLIDIKAVCKILSRSKASIYRDIAAGFLSKPKKIVGSSRWPRSEILKYAGLVG
jgi:predicted DNA-binding transcriptional regulator AlpA